MVAIQGVDGVAKLRVRTLSEWAPRPLRPSGNRALAARHVPHNVVDQDLWLFDLDRDANPQMLTFAPSLKSWPAWLTNARFSYGASGGERTIYEQTIGGQRRSWFQASGSSGVTTIGNGHVAVFVGMANPTTRADLWIWTEKGPPDGVPLITREGDQAQAQLSPDGRWLAYVSNETGRNEVFVAPFRYYSPPANSGSVHVWAETYATHHLTDVEWYGCWPASYTSCYVDTSTPGPVEATWWGLFVNVWVPRNVVIQVQEPPPPPPELRLLLEVAGEPQQFAFDPANPQSTDAAPTFVPGSYRNASGDSTSVAVQPEGTPLQTVRVIAAFVNASGQIVPPPVAQVTFSLHETSAFEGYAMNAGASEEPDFAFASGQPQVTAGFSGNLSWANVNVFDYGGITTARVSAEGFQPVNLRIPLDENNNWISDAGWRAYGHQGHPAQQVDDCTGANCQWADEDANPLGEGPLESIGLRGDSLTWWEEYRGFIVQGVHTRTSPAYKDLFVSSNVTREGAMEVEDYLTPIWCRTSESSGFACTTSGEKTNRILR